MTNTAILPHEPKKPAPFSTRGQWILFWVTLVLVGTWAILVQTDRAPELPSWIREPWFVFPLLLVVIVTIGIRQQRAIRKFNVLNLEALDMQARGDGVGALARMEELEKSWPRPRAVRVVVQLNCAWLLLRQGELWRASS